MNKTLETFARNWIVVNLSKLPEGNQRKFKLMYARNDGDRSVKDAVQMNIFDVVKEIPADKLDWAMQQIENSTK